MPAGRKPRVPHVNTADGDQRFVEGQEIEAARAAGVDASHPRFFPRRNVPSPHDAVFGADVVWVSGGSLVALLAVWRAHGLGFLPGSLCVHTDSDPRRLPAYRAAIEAGVLADGVALDEGVGVVYRDRELVEAVSERADGRAIRISANAPEQALPVRTLMEESE